MSRQKTFSEQAFRPDLQLDIHSNIQYSDEIRVPFTQKGLGLDMPLENYRERNYKLQKLRHLTIQ